MAQFLVNALVVLIVIGAVAAAVVGWKSLISHLNGQLSALWSHGSTFAERWARIRHPLGMIGSIRSRRDGSLSDLQEQLLKLVYGRCRRSRGGSLLCPTMVAVACHEVDYATLTQAHNVLERELTDDLRRWEPTAKPVKVVLSSALTATRGRLRVTSADFGAATVAMPPRTYAKTQVDVPSAAFLQYSTGEMVPLRREGTTIGREGDLRVADSKVSRQHAQVLCAGDDWYVRDMESLNGTKVNGNTITSQAGLRDGDRVCVGDTLLVFRLRHRASTSRRGEKSHK